VEGRRFDVAGWCFRHEPSPDPARLQSFRMHEWVRMGEGAEVSAERDRWVEAGANLLADLALDVDAVVANDPFFGRGGQILASSQRDSGLKVELTVTIGDGPVAVGSCNDHLDHFGEAFGIETAAGAVAHSACVGFGLERVALALLSRHGLDVAGWPARVADALWP
jgi:seryl-tRNA synthetase